MDTGKYNAHPGSREHLRMDTGKYKTPPGSEGAPTWTLVITRHLLEAGSTYMDIGKYNVPPEARIT